MDENRYKELVRKIKEWQNGQTHFTAQVFGLIAKADPSNLRKITAGFPEEVEAYHRWMSEPEAKGE